VSEVREGRVVTGLVPTSMRIHVFRDGDAYVLDFEERYEKPEGMGDEEFAKVVEESVALYERVVDALRATGIRAEFRYAVGEGGRSVAFFSELRGPLRRIMNVPTGVFLAYSDLGELKVADLLSLAALGPFLGPALLRRGGRGTTQGER